MADSLSKGASARPIGVFDSGVGGISVLKHIQVLLPHEDLLYVADSAHAPYGNKPPEFIRDRAFALSEFLIGQGVKALVVACNTATASAISALRERYSIPIIGMEPAVKPAVAATKTGVIGVLATVGTLKSAQFAGLLENYGQNVKVVTEGCPGLVECIERGELEAAETRKLLRGYIEPLLKAGADTIVLGCTHYPFVKPLIQEIAGTEVTLIDTGMAVARQLQVRLIDKALQKESQEEGKIALWTNSPASGAGDVMMRLWGGQASIALLA